MKLDDFRYMYRGKVISTLRPEEASLLAPIVHETAGRKRALLMFHGFSSSPAVFRLMHKSLLAQYDAVICPVLPGHGESIKTFSSVQAAEWIASAEHECERLTQDYAQVDVMGFSLGGLLACHLSAHFPIHHLYLLAPALSLHLNVPWTLKAARFLHRLGLRKIRNRAGNLLSNRHPEIAYRQVPLNAIIQILSLINEFKWAIPTCPVDVFLGRQDEVVDSLKIAERFAGLPKTKIHWLEHSGHVLPLDADVDLILASIQSGRLDD